jgi:hypothetical protein
MATFTGNPNFMRQILLVISCSFFLNVQAQTFDWWANNVQWDGVTHWSRYLIFSPGYFGPNALPVPEIGNGSIDSITSVGITGNLHFSKGDNTQNIKLIGNFCVVKNAVSINLAYIPAEWFQMDHATKTRRRIYYQFYDNKNCDGDLYVNTVFQLFNKWRKNIHLALRIGYQFPTSSSYGAARYMDSPAYNIDISAGKTLSPGGPLKLVAMAGFYAWQTNDDELFQDDALLVGVGLEYNKKDWRIQVNNCTYYGYRANGDDPMVFRIGIQKGSKRLTGILRFQQGLHNFDYSSFEGGMKYNFK